MRLTRPLYPALAFVFGLAALTACSGSDEQTPAVRDTAGVVVEAGTADAFSLREGDCIAEPEIDDVSDVEATPCDDEYDLQIYLRFDQPGAEYTGDATLRAQAQATCTPAFGERIGIPYSDSVLEYRTIVPSEISWAHGDHSIYCAVYDPASPVSAPLLASAR